jgi:hypothetical protein
LLKSRLDGSLYRYCLFQLIRRKVGSETQAEVAGGYLLIVA